MHENGRLREDLGRMKVEFDNAKLRLEAADNEKRTAEEQRSRDAKIAQIQANEPAFMLALRKFGTVAKTDRGIVFDVTGKLLGRPACVGFRSDCRTQGYLVGRDSRQQS